MLVSDAVRRIIELQESAERDAELAMERATRKNASKGERARWGFLAKQRREDAAALDAAIRSMTGAP